MDALIEHAKRMAAYNAAANKRLYDAVAQLPQVEFVKERPVFFTSIRGTLNHIITGDRIWLTRFEGGETPSTNLDAVPYLDFESLRRAREAEDERIFAFVDGLTADYFEGDIQYVANDGRTMTDPAVVLIAHFFNHQTHHRGQAHALLSQTDIPPPSLDMHRCLNP